jgi:uncharacterized repeat protein (TIGR01451 family)
MRTFTKKLLLPLACLFLSGLSSLRAQSVTITTSVVTHPCNNNGVATVTVLALTPPLSFTYSNWMANVSIVHTGITTTTDIVTGMAGYQAQWSNPNWWSVTASDGTNFAYGSFLLNPAFQDSIKIIPGTCPALSTLQAVGFSGGTSPYTCVWTNLTSNQVFTTNPAFVAPGNYGLMVTDGAGCQVGTANSGSTTINVWSNPTFTVGISGSAANCTNGTATVTVGSGAVSPFSYLWSNAATSPTLNSLTAGQYTCKVTDNIGCQATGYYYLQQAVTLTVNFTTTNATCLQNNGAAMCFAGGGTAPYTFAWSNGSTNQNLSGVTGGWYTVQLLDANGCTGMGGTSIGVSTPINVTYNVSPSSCTSSTGGATLTATGGASPYSVIWYTFPSNTTGTSISAKPSGNYSFKVTDANGCIRTGAAFIPQTGTISAVLSNYAVVCPATTGSVVANVSGSNPPYTYQWSNGATTSVITGVALGSYNCTITSAIGCKVYKSGSLSQVSPVNVGLNTNFTSCLYSTNGSIIAQATGGTSPYTYQWSNGPTTPANTGLGVGNYVVTATDANGCKATKYGYVGNSGNANNCYCTIMGTVYVDANSNCVRNAGENGVHNIQVHCSGFGYAYTDVNGVYRFQVPTGTYTISETVHQLYPLASCQANNQTVSVVAANNCTSTVNFANNVVPLHDLHVITCNWNWPIPGNQYSQKVIVQNDGTINETTGKFAYKHDGQLSYLGSSNWALAQPNNSFPTWYRVTSGFPSLTPQTSSSSFLTYNVATNIPINTQVMFNDTITHNSPIGTTWLTDNTPWNNVNTHYASVVASYDPNFKEVIPHGVGATGDITTTDSILTYVIHFQNTGSYFAQNIVLVDTISGNLRTNTLRPGYSDHKYSATLSDGGVLKFNFDNIMLPWKSQYGDNMSSGMVTYSIKMKKNLPVGSTIRNKAAIYFDYNEPVITNNTINTIVAGTGVSIEEHVLRGKNDALLFPNPANTWFTLLMMSDEASKGTLSVYDINGRQVSTREVELEAGENRLLEKTADLSNGIYFVQLKTDNVNIGKKLVITK